MIIFITIRKEFERKKISKIIEYGSAKRGTRYTEELVGLLRASENQ